METLQHDPRTKQQIKDLLYAYLYEPVQQRFRKRLDGIIAKNTVLTGANHNSFTYKGEFYSSDSAPAPRKMNRLSPTLYGEMDKYLGELKELNDRELPYVLGFITHVLNSSNDLHDYLRILPQAVHKPIQELIATCPCRSKKLTDADVDHIKNEHQKSIDLLKQRMVANLLI